MTKLALLLLLLSLQNSTNTFTPCSLSYASALHLWLLGKEVLSLGKQACGVSNTLSYRGFCIAAPDGSPRSLCKYSYEWKLLSYFAGICNSFYSCWLFSCWGCSYKGQINIQSARAWDAPASVMKCSSYFSWWSFKETSAFKGKVTLGEQKVWLPAHQGKKAIGGWGHPHTDWGAEVISFNTLSTESRRFSCWLVHVSRPLQQEEENRSVMNRLL